MAQKKIGAKIVIDGEQEFRAALNQSKTALKEFDSEMKLVTSQFKDNEKSMEALKAKQEVYQKQQQELTKQSKILVEQIKKANDAYKEATDAQEKQADKIKEIEKALEDAKKEYGDSSEEVQKLEKELAEANEEYDKQERQITQLSGKISKWNTDLNRTQTELIETDRALADTNDSIENFDKDVDDVEESTKKFGITIGEASQNTDTFKVSLGSLVSAQVIVDVLRSCASAIKDVASAALDVGMKFEASMSNVQALSGASGDSLARLSEKAKEMGATTMYSASESADAMSYMALAGWDVEQMLDGINPVLQLAAASNMELAEASDIVTDYITAFGLKASDASHFADAMATAMSTSNTTVELLGESYKNCAATCGSMGIEMEDATAVLATMANAGVKGGEAGTALNTILTRLATNTKGAADALEEYGIDVYDSEGRMNSLSSILNGLGEVWGDLSDKEQAALAKTIAGTSQYSKFQTIMLGVSDAAKEGGMSFNDYASALRNCDGAAEAMAKTMQDNLAGDITILKSALEGLGIATEGVFDESFRHAVKGATDAVGQLERAVTQGDLGVSLAGLGDAIANMTDNLIESAERALPGFIDKLTWIINNVNVIGGGITAIVTALVAYKAASVAATIATEGFTVALEANPIGLAAAAVAGLTVALFKLSDASDAAFHAETENTKATNEFISAHETLMKGLDDSAQKRRTEIANMDLQKETSKKLVAELFSEASSQERKAAIIRQLKELYPDLNLAIDEQGKVIGATKEQLDKYIDSSIEAAKVEAAREHLTEISKDLFDAEMALADANEKVAEQVKEVNKAQAQATEDLQKHTDMNGVAVEVYNEYDVALEQAQENLTNLTQAQIEAQHQVESLGEEYDKTLAYIDNTQPIVDATAATEELGEQQAKTVQFTEEMEDSFRELQTSLEESISSSLDLTSKWASDWQTTTAAMTENIQSQIQGIEEWKENFQTLADSSEVSIDERVLKYLADLGTDGAGLVKELMTTLKESPDELQGWADSMAEYLSLEDSVASEITDTYITAVEDAMQGASDALADGTDIILEGTTALTDGIKTALDDSELTEAFKEAGETMPTSMAEGIGETSEEVSTATTETIDSAIKVAEDKESEFPKKGENYNKGLARGLKVTAAKDAAKEMATTVDTAVKDILNDESGYQIGNTWLEGLIRAINEKGDDAVAAARSKASEAQNVLNSINAGHSSGQQEAASSPNGSTMSMDRTIYTPNTATFNNIRATVPSQLSMGYLPLLDSINGLGTTLDSSIRRSSENMNVNVQLMGEAKDIFNVVNDQNTKLVNSTGFHALS